MGRRCCRPALRRGGSLIVVVANALGGNGTDAVHVLRGDSGWRRAWQTHISALWPDRTPTTVAVAPLGAYVLSGRLDALLAGDPTIDTFTLRRTWFCSGRPETRCAHEQLVAGRSSHLRSCLRRCHGVLIEQRTGFPEELIMTAPNVDLLALTDLSDPVMFTNPFPRYAALRRDAPVSRVWSKQLVRRGGYLLTRYDDVMMLHTDRRFSNDLMINGRPGLMRFMPRMFRLLADSMVFKDDPDHQRLRGLVNKAFTPKLVQGMTGDIERTAARLLDDLGGHDVIDLVEHYAVPLPLSVISKMLGVGDAERDQFHLQTKRFIDGALAGPVQLIRTLPTGQRMIRLFERLAEQRRTQPDGRVISALVRANDEGDRLNSQELIAMIFLLLLAGHETTANFIGSATLALIDHPEQLTRLRNNPQLINTAVEELLRYTTPSTCGAARIALEDLEVAGVKIPKGSNLLGMIISANRDEDVFQHPDELDLGRNPNRHLTFAFGAHHCLGHQLARIEAKTALAALVQRFEHIELACPRSELQYKPTHSLRGLRSLPVRLR